MKHVNSQMALGPDRDGKTAATPTPETKTETIHLYIRGNYRQDIFFDKVDFINAWNRLWLSAKATKVKILAAELLSNHLHLCIQINSQDSSGKSWTKPGGPPLSNFVHHLRMSLSLYFNHRHNVHGSLGSRRYGCAMVKPLDEDGGDDIRDLIRYIHRNVTHHNITKDYPNWPYSTFKHTFSLNGTQTILKSKDIPKKLTKAYLPSTCILPEDWTMTPNGMLIPPPELFPVQYLEQLFQSKAYYLKAHDTPTRREHKDEGEKSERLLGFKSARTTSDQDIIDFVSQHSLIPIVSMTREQIQTAIQATVKELPKVSLRQLSRIFHVPASTIGFWLSK